MDDQGTLPHRAALCAQDRGSDEQFKVYEKLLYQQTTTNISLLLKLAEDVGIADMETCLDESNYTLFLLQETKRAKEYFSLTTLPTYILIDKDSGSRIKIPGLYEAGEVVEAISILRK